MAMVLGVSSPSGMAVTSAATVPPRKGQGHGKEHEVAKQHADGRAGDHVLQGKSCRKVKNRGQ